METYYGHVRTPADAIILFEACRMGLLPRVQRRLSEKERQSIRSGSVFVWDEREAGMRRWTDGKSWSASRVSGSFLTYREMEGKRGGGSVSQNSAARAGKTPESTRGSDEDHADGTDEGPDGYRYKPNGLMKQSFSITTSTEQHLHLISYYSRSHPSATNLQQPTNDPALRHVRPQKGLYPESTVNDQQNLPVVTRGPMAGAAYSISPHVGGYPPRGTHAPSYTPSYAWPPTPLATPPTVAVPYGAAFLPAVPAANGHPPPPYGQPPHQSPPNQHHPHSLPPPPPHGLPAPCDRPAHIEPTLPPGAPPTASQTAGAPMYHGRSPRSFHELRHDPQRSPMGNGQAPPATNGAGPGMHSPHMVKQEPPSSFNPISTPPKLSEASANAVPGIGSLMNGASLAPLSTSTATAGGHPPSSANGAGELLHRHGPRDIPNEKLGLGVEDVRALRQLDRAFIV